MQKYFYLLFFLFSIGQLWGQDTTSTTVKTEKNFKLTPLPVLFYLPETGLGYGALGIATFRFKEETPESRPSSLQLALSYTTKKQIIVFAPYELYWKNEKWRLVGELGYYKYFYNFYGIGIDSREEDFETYEVNFPRVRTSLLYEVIPNVSFGLAYELEAFYNLKTKAGGILENTPIDGKDDGGTLSNIGLQGLYDSRDNIFFPKKGFFIQANAFTAAEFLGSDFDYSKFSFDARYYYQIKGDHIIASNFFIANNGEGTPFLNLNFLGSSRTRGFDNRRFQDHAELSFATEYRFPIKGRIGAVAFASTATVAADLDGVFSNRFRFAGGLGLRYVINKKDGIRVRADYGYSKEGGNIYITIREAF